MHPILTAFVIVVVEVQPWNLVEIARGIPEFLWNINKYMQIQTHCPLCI